MDPAKKEALLKRLAEGRKKTKAARDEAKAKGLPDPKPRKKRASKNGNAEPVDTKEALADPLDKKPARETIAPIDGAPAEAVNKVAAMPPSPEENKTTKIDVPNLPDAKGRKKIVPDADVIPEAKDKKGLSTTGLTKKYNDNVMIRSEETGSQVISAQYPGQEESILKVLKKNKKENTPLAPAPNPVPADKTIAARVSHTPDVKAVQGRVPFSFSAIKKTLHQN